jgi:hypothetical protein
MTTSMRLLPVRVTPDLRQLIDQVGAVNPASRALILLGAAAAGLDLHGLEREIARLLAADLDERVQAGLRQLLTSTTHSAVALPPTIHQQALLSEPPSEPAVDDPFASIGIEV